MRVEGMDGLLKTLRELPDAVERGAVTTGTRKAAMLTRKVLRQAARSGWAESTGNLSKAIRIKKIKRKHARKGPRYLVGVWGAFKKGGGPNRWPDRSTGYYGLYLDRGTKHIRPTNWALRAWNSARHEVLREMLSQIDLDIEKQAGRLAARNKHRK